MDVPGVLANESILMDAILFSDVDHLQIPVRWLKTAMDATKNFRKNVLPLFVHGGSTESRKYS